MRDNKQHDRIIKDIAKKYNVDKRVVNHIVSHLFLFLKKVISDPKDNRPVRFRYWGVWAIIKGREKE